MVIVAACVSSSSGSAASVLVLDSAGAAATGTASSQAAEDAGDAGGSEAGASFSSGCGSAELLNGDALNRRREGHRERTHLGEHGCGLQVVMDSWGVSASAAGPPA